MTVIAESACQSKSNVEIWPSDRSWKKLKMAHHLLSRSKRASSENGFTVLEAVFAVSILAVGILAVASLQGSAIRSNGSAMELADITARTSSQLEALSMLPFSAHELNAEENPHRIEPKPSDPYQVGLTWNVTDSPSGNMKTIHMKANWNDRGAPKELSLGHILSNNRY
jgi:type IV pilus assembly protein PilV